jgi:hypothetical protein
MTWRLYCRYRTALAEWYWAMARDNGLSKGI